MTFEEMVKAGKKFTSGINKITITDTNVENGKSGVMLGIIDERRFLFFDRETGKCVSIDGKLKHHDYFDLVPVNEE